MFRAVLVGKLMFVKINGAGADVPKRKVLRSCTGVCWEKRFCVKMSTLSSPDLSKLGVFFTAAGGVYLKKTGMCWSENADSLIHPREKGQLQQTRCLYVKKGQGKKP